VARKKQFLLVIHKNEKQKFYVHAHSQADKIAFIKALITAGATYNSDVERPFSLPGSKSDTADEAICLKGTQAINTCSNNA